MAINKKNIQRISDHWLGMAERDFETMNHLYECKDFHWSLFIGHIVIEKLLKAVVVKRTGEHAPFTHDLRKLAKVSEMDFSETHLNWLDTTTTFNLNTRYDNYKQEFYKKCTPEFASKWINNIKELRQWIKKQL